jgi:hypothetical protein
LTVGARTPVEAPRIRAVILTVGARTPVEAPRIRAVTSAVVARTPVEAPRIRAVTLTVGTRTPLVAVIRLQRRAVTRPAVGTPNPAETASPRVIAKGLTKPDEREIEREEKPGRPLMGRPFLWGGTRNISAQHARRRRMRRHDPHQVAVALNQRTRRNQAAISVTSCGHTECGITYACHSTA